MTDVTIQNSSGVTFTFQEGDINTVTSIIVGDIDSSPMPGSGPRGAMAFDISGVIKTITVEGQLTVATSTVISPGTITTILQQKQWLESLLDGGQKIATATHGKFTSNYEEYSVKTSGNTIVDSSSDDEKTTCMVQKITFTEQTGNPEVLPFTITLIVGGI